MNFLEFREMLKRLIEDKKEGYKDFGESLPTSSDLAVVNIRDATRSEQMTIKINTKDLVSMILIAAGEPVRPWSSAELRGSNNLIFPNWLYLGTNDSNIELTINYSSRTEPINYKKD